MEISTSGSPPKLAAKRARLASAKPLTPAAARKPGSRKSVKSTVQTPAPAELTAMIATAAYHLAADRNFVPGQELDDWLAAERQILAVYG